MDRDRLKEVHQTDLTESRVNEDFVEWLKTKGPTWLLVILVARCAYIFMTRWKQHSAEKNNEAWGLFFQSSTPGDFEDIAAQYESVDELANLARREAADRLLIAIQAGLEVGATVGVDEPTAELDENQREQYLTRADGLYQAVLDTDDGSLSLTLHVVNAMNGKAAVAMTRGNTDEARQWYQKAAERAEKYYPGLAAEARARADRAGDAAVLVTFRSQAELNAARETPPVRNPVRIDEALRDLLLPDESGG